MKKGFTLIELIGTLIVLSIVAIIVVPNIQKDLNSSKKSIKVTQDAGIIEAAKNWVADHIEQVPTKNKETLYIFLSDIQNDGYISNKLYKDLDGNEYNSNVFIILECEVVKEDEYNTGNYKYKYTLYDTNEEHLKYLAYLYAIDKNVTTAKTVSLNDILPYANKRLVVENKLKNIDNGSLISNVSITIINESGNYTYTINE